MSTADAGSDGSRSDGDTDARDPPSPAADSADSEHSLVGADGRLIHTLVEEIPRGDAPGRVLVHVDVTHRRHRRKQVDVLNRLMRHNVRNDLNLLRGHAQRLADHDDEAVAESAAVIDRIADRWLGLAEKARQIEHLFGHDASDTLTVNRLVGAVRTSVGREWPDSTVRCSIDVDAALPVSERLVPAVVELCENGIKHADADTVSVRITAADAPEWVDVAVVDRGPGIPDHERAALRAEQETPLQHGSGLGFWIVRFVVRQLGGRISVAEPERAGSVVTLSVPTAATDGDRRARN